MWLENHSAPSRSGDYWNKPAKRLHVRNYESGHSRSHGVIAICGKPSPVHVDRLRRTPHHERVETISWLMPRARSRSGEKMEVMTVRDYLWAVGQVVR